MSKKSCLFVFSECNTLWPRSRVPLYIFSILQYVQEVLSLVYVKYTTVWPRRCVPLYVLNLVYGEYTSLCPRSLVPLYTVSVLQYVKEDLSLSICWVCYCESKVLFLCKQWVHYCMSKKSCPFVYNECTTVSPRSIVPSYMISIRL